MNKLISTIGSIASVPLTLPGVKIVTKTAIKGGLMVADKATGLYKQVGTGLRDIVREAREEMKETKKDTGSKTQTAEKESAKDYESMSFEELYDLAQDLDIKGRSTMNKEELIEQIRKSKSGK